MSRPSKITRIAELTAIAVFDDMVLDHRRKTDELRAERLELSKMAKRLGIAWPNEGEPELTDAPTRSPRP